jgi:hypothetical protein
MEKNSSVDINEKSAFSRVDNTFTEPRMAAFSHAIDLPSVHLNSLHHIVKV